MRKSIFIALTVSFIAVAIVQRASSQAQDSQIHFPPVRFPFGSAHVGTAMTSPNIGNEGTLDVLEGGGSSRVLSYDIQSGIWQPLTYAPTGVEHGAAISNLFNDCDFAFAGGGSNRFFTTGTLCKSSGVLADTPAPVDAGAAVAAAMGVVGSPVDSVFAFRGGGTRDFWQYGISQNKWTVLPQAPAPVGDGAALVEALNCDGNWTRLQFQIAALRGNNSRDFWCFDIPSGAWITGPGIPPFPAAIGPGASLAQLQRIGRIYALRGGGTSDFYQLQSGRWAPLSNTPGPVNAGGALVGINYGTRSQRDVLYALQGGSSSAIWRYDVASDTWTHISNLPIIGSQAIGK
jgi:hypothetical protein